jgi:hypothetical protein
MEPYARILPDHRASAAQVRAFEDTCGGRLPPEYREFLRKTNGGLLRCGAFGVTPAVARKIAVTLSSHRRAELLRQMIRLATAGSSMIPAAYRPGRADMRDVARAEVADHIAYLAMTQRQLQVTYFLGLDRQRHSDAEAAAVRTATRPGVVPIAVDVVSRVITLHLADVSLWYPGCAGCEVRISTSWPAFVATYRVS